MKTTHKTNPHIAVWLAIAASVALMYWLRPTTNENRYVYDMNRPWNYNLLTAPFDIPVYHDTVSSMAIRDSLANAFEPVYKRAATTESQILSRAESRLIQLSTVQLSERQRAAIMSQLRQVYRRGIIDPSAIPETRDSLRARNVRIISGDVAQSFAVDGFLTPRMAYASLDSALTDPELHHAISAARIFELLEPNVVPDSAATARFRQEEYATALAPIGVIQHGERIINRGDIVTPQLYTILSTYEKMTEERGGDSYHTTVYQRLGTLGYILMLMGGLVAFIWFFRRDYYRRTDVMLFLISVVTLFTLMAYGLNSAFRLGIYVVPLAIVPIVVLVFLDSRTAFFTGLTTALICSMVAQNHWEFLILQLAGMLAAVTVIRELSKRSQLIQASVIVFLAYGVAFAVMELMAIGTFNSLVPKMLMALAINAVLISFAYFLIFLMEKVFGFTSRVTLLELADINHPLLRELSEQAPGTFNHSMSVSNLASAAASHIGANVQMVRTGALYHDIGKVKNPAFFTENQHGLNPHNALTPIQSARIVIGHVTDGLKSAENAKLPQAIRDFIAQHHGRGTARYFYTTYANEHPGETIDPAPFTYPGPNPQTREASIVMMADAVEAASRSLKEYTPEAIKALVDKIVDAQVKEGLHDESPLSFRDVGEIKKVFVSRLRTMYHSRIAYPELK